MNHSTIYTLYLLFIFCICSCLINVVKCYIIRKINIAAAKVHPEEIITSTNVSTQTIDNI